MYLNKILILKKKMKTIMIFLVIKISYLYVKRLKNNLYVILCTIIFF